MSETQKANPNRTRATKVAGTKKAVIADSTNDKVVPVKKTAPKRKTTTVKDVVAEVDAVVTAAETHKDVVEAVVAAAAAKANVKVTTEQVDEVLTKAPGFWAKIKKVIGF
jgi:hypothetical protein